MSNLKVLHVLNHSIPHLDGYCIRSKSIVLCQRAQGLDPVVVTSPHHEPLTSGPVEVFDDIRYYRMKKSNGSRFTGFHEAAVIWRMANRIGEVIRDESPDLIHAHSPCTWGVAALIAARKARLPVAYEARGLWEGQSSSGKPRLKYRLARRLERWMTRRVNAVVALSPSLLEVVHPSHSRRCKGFVVPNGVDATSFRPECGDVGLKEKLGFRATDLCIGYIGSLYEFEGVMDLLQIMPRLISLVPNVKLVIVGGGPMENRLLDTSRELKLGEAVCITGRVAHTEVARYYAMMDVMTYPRRRNRTTEVVTPLKPLEAAAMRKPIIASDVGGIVELLGTDSAAYFRAGDLNSLEKECFNLIDSSERRDRLAAAAFGHVCEERTWQSVCRKYNCIYEHAIHQQRSRFS